MNNEEGTAVTNKGEKEIDENGAVVETVATSAAVKAARKKPGRKKKVKTEKTFKVTAKFAVGKFGFFNNKRRYDGDPFEVTEKQFSERWMIRDGT